MSVIIPRRPMRALSQYRSLPLETLNATWLAEGVIGAVNTFGQKQLRPGQLGPGAVDEFGIQLVRVVAGAPYPSPLPALTTSNQWTSVNVAAANVVATTTRAAPGVGFRNVCTGIVASIGAFVAFGALVGVSVILRDGASGVGPVLLQRNFITGAQPLGTYAFDLTDLNIIGSANTAMCLEMSAAGGANTFEIVNLIGYTVPA